MTAISRNSWKRCKTQQKVVIFDFKQKYTSAPVLDDEAPASTATNGATSVDDSMVSSKDDSRFFEAEPDADLYDVPDRDIFDKFPNNDEDTESHDIATSSFSDGYKCFWR